MQDKTSSTPSLNSGADQRRYPRLTMAMKAVIRGGILDDTECVIRDFAPGGLLIKWLNDKGGEYLEQSQAIEGSSFVVEFSVKLKNAGRKTYSIDFKVVRLFQGGMGVSFIEPDQHVLNTLIKIAGITGQKAKERLQESRKQASAQEGYDATMEAAATRGGELESSLSMILSTFLKKFSNRLINQTKNTFDEADKFDFFNANNQLSEDLDGYLKALLAAVTAQLKDEPPLVWEKSDNEELNGNNLSLVDEKEFEAYLLLTEIISNAEAENKILLFRATKVISESYDLVPDEGSNPIGFSRLFRTIDEYFQYNKYGYASLKEAYREMQASLVPEMVLLYTEMTENMEFVPEYKSNKERSSVFPNNDLNETVSSTENLSPAYGVAQPDTSPGIDQSNNKAGFPTLEGQTAQVNGQAGHSAIEPSPVIKGIDDLTQTLSALKNSLIVPESLDQTFNHRGDFSQIQSPDGSQPYLGQRMPGAVGDPIQHQELLQLLNKIQLEDNQKWQNDDTIYGVTSRLEPMLNEQCKHLNLEDQNAVGLVSGVLDFLRGEQQLSQNVRRDLSRIQTVLYKQALSGAGHFQQPSNPLRNIINVLEKLDKHGANSNPEARQVIDDLVGKILALESYDPGQFSQITDGLNSLLEKQTAAYDQHMHEIVEQCEREQALVSNIKRESVTDKSNVRAQADQQTDGQWSIWEQRAQKMGQGDTVLVTDGRGEKQQLTLAWSDPDATQFVFVDNEGEKTARMTRQELVVRLLKGSAEITDRHGQPVFDRAIVSSLFNAYDDVKDQIINDPETGFLNEQNFKTELQKIHKNALRDHSEHALFYFETAIDNDKEKASKNSAYMKHVAEQIDKVFGEHCLTGRVSVNTITIVAEYISREGAMILGETLFKELEEQAFEYEDETCSYPAAIGISIINDLSEDIDEIIISSRDACEQSKTLGENQAVIANDFDSVVTDEDKFDWSSWLQEYIDEDVVVPLFGQTIEFSSDSQSKPLLHIFTANEDEENNLFSPDRFLRASKDEALISQFEKHAFISCLNWMAEHRKTVSLYQKCIFNFSTHTVNSRGILDFIIQELSQSSVPPGKLCFLIPANVGSNNNSAIERFIRTLSEFGCQFSIAQYGNDFLNQETLKLPVSYISIDSVLINDVVTSAQNFGLIKSINDIARMLDKQTIVLEAVEDDALELLKELEVDYLPAESDLKNSIRLNPVSLEEIV